MLDFITSIYEQGELPQYKTLHSLLEECISTLEAENSFYRPYSKFKGKSFGGGLLDFVDWDEDLPVIVVPDIHARQGFILDVLNYILPDSAGPDCAGLPVFDALKENKLFLVCVGDLFHSESRCAPRWKEALKKYSAGEVENDEMKAEMVECLGVLQMVLALKNAFPDNFHVLKGNHENILNASDKGNHPFYKLADEGNMVYDFMSSHYDDLIIQEIDWFESKLPVCAAFRNIVVSHAEPVRSFSRKEIINYHSDYEAVYGLTWTQNDFAEAGSVEDTIKNLLGSKYSQDAKWISGHRPVSDSYALRQGGRLIQIHNPSEENIAIVAPDRVFDPESDIFCVE